MTPQEQQAFDLMREALESSKNWHQGDKWRYDPDNRAVWESHRDTIDEALSAAKAMSEAQNDACEVLATVLHFIPASETDLLRDVTKLCHDLRTCGNPQASEPEKSLHELLRMGAEENEQLKAKLAGMEKLLRFKEAKK